jgi:hypothetical protein
MKFLSHSHPSVVLAAVETLKRGLDDWEFRPEEYLPFLDDHMVRLLRWITQVEDAELRMKITVCIIAIVERMDTHILPYIPNLITMVRQIWEDSSDNLSASVTCLHLVSSLVTVAKDGVSQWVNFVIPMVTAACAITYPDWNIALLEDGLLCWRNILHHVNDIDPLMELLHHIPSLLELDGESVRWSLEIIESYLMLDNLNTLRTCGIGVLKSLLDLLGPTTSSHHATSPVNILVCRVIETLWKSSNDTQFAWNLISNEVPIVSRLMHGVIHRTVRIAFHSLGSLYVQF